MPEDMRPLPSWLPCFAGSRSWSDLPEIQLKWIHARRSCPPLPFTLVFGNEGSGLPPEFARYGQPVRIESNDRVDSLNLAVAAGIAIYGFAKPFVTPES